MQLRIKLFGGLQKYYPGYHRPEGIDIEVPDGTTAGGLLRFLKIPESTGCIVIAGGKILTRSDPLAGGSEVRIMLPLYGG